MTHIRVPLLLALLACTTSAQAQSLAVRVDDPEWGQVLAVEAVGSKGTAWRERCYAAGVQDHAGARYIDGRGQSITSKAQRQAWLGSITAQDLALGRLGPVVRVNDNAPASVPGQVVLRADQQGALERDLACVAQASAVGNVVAHEIAVVSGGRLFKWRQMAGEVLPQEGAWVRTPVGAVMAGYAPGHTPPAPPRGDWSDTYYIGYPYAERYSAPVVDDHAH